MSPDALVQMSIVFAYYALYGKVVAVHEPVLTKVTFCSLMHEAMLAD